MNGAQSLIASLVRSGVEVCFANPGTSEMHFVAALDPGPKALSMFDLSNPDIDFCKLAQVMGIEAMRFTIAAEFNKHFAYCMANKGPHLIEATI